MITLKTNQMKDIKALIDNIADPRFFDQQFNEHADRHILFVSPMLRGNDFYKMILPYLMLKKVKGVKTALTGLEKYDPEKSIVDVKMLVTEVQIRWADVIVMPFTTQPLKDTYATMREINPKVQISFLVDFNFYELGSSHKFHDLFALQSSKADVEDNIYYADKVLMANEYMIQQFIDRFTALKETRYKDLEHVPNAHYLPIISHFPFLFSGITPRNNPDDEIIEIPVKRKVISKSKGKTKGKKMPKQTMRKMVFSKASITELIDAGVSREMAIKSLIPSAKEYKIQKRTEAFRIGIVCTENNFEDLNYFSNAFKKINTRFKDKVELVFYGWDGKHKNKKWDALKGVNFIYEKPLPIHNFFKKLYDLNFDCMLIPCKESAYNQTSETLAKIIEFGAFSLPVLANGKIDVYDKLLADKENAILFNGKDDLANAVDWCLKNKKQLTSIGNELNALVYQNFTYGAPKSPNETNYKLMYDVF